MFCDYYKGTDFWGLPQIFLSFFRARNYAFESNAKVELVIPPTRIFLTTLLINVSDICVSLAKVQFFIEFQKQYANFYNFFIGFITLSQSTQLLRSRESVIIVPLECKSPNERNHFAFQV